MLRLPQLNLGELEMAALACLWSIGEGDVKRVHGEIGISRGVALNTVQSALDRLHGKKLLQRRKLSHAFIYSAGIERSELVGRAISGVLAMMGSGAGEMLTAFVDVAARTDPAVLTELEALLADRISAARTGADRARG